MIFIKSFLPHHDFNSQSNFWESADPHSDFETELATGIAASGTPDVSRMTLAETQPPNGFILVFTVVPSAGAPIGSSPESSSGPILDPSRMGLVSDGDLLRDEAVFDPGFDTYYPSPLEIAPPLAVDGWSHLPFLFGESSAFVPFTPSENYRFVARLTDKLGEGWTVSVTFAVE